VPDSIEEKILDLHRSKRDLASDLLEGDRGQRQVVRGRPAEFDTGIIAQLSSTVVQVKPTLSMKTVRVSIATPRLASNLRTTSSAIALPITGLRRPEN